ncbi:hypothetical protein F5144DRAFT_381272 [Chaetomium tenue]|uniref:Uncharacterized protein n=1 Tax=Chaetomium tenue TaxID=1854479 RepID=A0ACB7NUJ0_9PEZI|nr:hypothetical protein F5144DRAFT_381272 [Chaetomium globosum]
MESKVWQDKLEVVCVGSGVAKPTYQLVSDTRGGRTAWSSSVTVHGSTYKARYWYAGLVNAKEDAAEVAMKFLNVPSSSSSPASSPATSRRGW